MKSILHHSAQIQALLVCLLLLPLGSGADSFVDLTVEIESNDWDYWFLCDRIGKYPGEKGSPTVFTPSRARHCVVGTDSWMIESEGPAFKVTRWFTGSNIVEYTVIKQPTPEAVITKTSKRTGFAMTAPPAGQKYTRIYDSLDGNPGRPVRVADLMVTDFPATVSWLAFCSGPSLKREGRRVFPPSSLWKESSIVYLGWSDFTEVFKDSLGLPKSINLVSTNSQSIFQYQVRQSTNVLGWNFPLEFYGVQYIPTGTNAWKLQMTFKGRVTAIGACARPEIPPEVMKAILR